MIRQRISTLLTTLSLVLSLAAVSGAVPASTLAATPNVTFGAGALSSSQATGATAPIVGTGDVVGFNVWATNSGTSNISQFFLSILAPGGALVYKITPSTGQCDTNVPTNCSFGQLRPGKSVTVSVAYNTALSYVGNPPTLATSCPLGAQTPGGPLPAAGVFGAEVMCLDFVWSTVGFTTSDPGSNSHGDTFQWHDGVELNSSPDFGGHAFVDSSLLTVQNDQFITAANPQATKVTLPLAAAAHFAWVQDGGTEGSCTISTNTFACSDLFGQTSIVNVDDNRKFSQYFVLTITIDASLVAVPKNKLVVWHSYIDANGNPQQELISASCTKVPTKCLIVTTGTAFWTIEIHTLYNGLWRVG
jgi:hypothetical protein